MVKRLRHDVERKQVAKLPLSKLPRKGAIESNGTRTKTDTGWQEEHSKTRGRTFVKELGKMTP